MKIYEIYPSFFRLDDRSRWFGHSRVGFQIKLEFSNFQSFVFFFDPYKKHNGIENSKNNGGKVEVEY